ncbi:MAG: hypothetical protein EKK29_07020 [Hyphomicrobiales bacterium]|nr:MAG: hypothetical protein EKK29_07020 [Hyphomicrobiales bacterium]
MAYYEKSLKIPVAERLIEGCYLTVAELCALKSVGKTTVYLDIKQGLLPIEKMSGRMVRIAGPIARDYRPRVGIVKAA